MRRARSSVRRSPRSGRESPSQDREPPVCEPARVPQPTGLRARWAGETAGRAQPSERTRPLLGPEGEVRVTRLTAALPGACTTGYGSSARSAGRPAVVLAALALALSGCASEENVVKYRPFFTGIQGAEFATDPVNPSKGYVDPTAVADNRIVIEHDDGSRTFVARSPRHVMVHVETLLDEDDPRSDRVLLDQLVSEKTKEFYRSEGKDPLSFVTDLRARRTDVAKTFGRMPMGEHTPTVLIDQPGDNIWVLRITGSAGKDLVFTKVWFRLEGTQWRLMWMV